ncbi:hypothetical protein [Deinococcus soli (ex Cha et al. 2016)]|uniref:hypothetical protein n=1 Tax=Deinococcus soli (ex Cha et al. 2016) TaxID=1309411 RepID=UPI001669E856|nr:hypothetical protein [Deinococcus soli (ex Cha et al. 2016)]GGB70768.1 hypothetical protein GCM10008019_28680 [Deinococcus soli (ex Cha et al. 2016)]
MHYLVITAAGLNESRTVAVSPTYAPMFERYLQEERQLQPAGFVLLAELSGPPEAVETAGHQLPLTDPAVMRSALGSALAEQYAQSAAVQVTLTAQDYANLNEQKYLILHLANGHSLSDDQLSTLSGLVTFLDTVQDAASERGVPDGVIWPGVPFGTAAEHPDQVAAPAPHLVLS